MRQARARKRVRGPSMGDFWRQSHWFYRALFLSLALLILFVRLLPLGTEPGALPGPDLVLCLILAWIVRRPDYLPMLLILVVLLVEDLILMRPPGLWTAIVVLATEFLRGRTMLTRELSFAVEYAMVSGLMIGMHLVYRLVLSVAVVPQPPFGLSAIEILWSILCYPLVVAASRLMIDLRKPATGEVDNYGRRV